MIGKFLTRLACLAAVTSFAWSASAAEILTPARYVYITDFESGKVLFAKDAEAPMKPASMAKIMTVFIVFQRIADGSLRLDDSFLVSEKAWRKGGVDVTSERPRQYASGYRRQGGLPAA